MDPGWINCLLSTYYGTVRVRPRCTTHCANAPATGGGPQRPPGHGPHPHLGTREAQARVRHATAAATPWQQRQRRGGRAQAPHKARGFSVWAGSGGGWVGAAAGQPQGVGGGRCRQPGRQAARSDGGWAVRAFAWKHTSDGRGCCEAGRARRPCTLHGGRLTRCTGSVAALPSRLSALMHTLHRRHMPREHPGTQTHMLISPCAP